MPSQTNERATVHVVDDNASMRGALEGLFDSVGLETQTYAAAREFLATSISNRPGCIVIDIRLPDMNGLDVQVQLTGMDVRLPVVMMTGHGDIPMSVRAVKRGAVDFLPEPFHDQDMLDAVMSAIERDRADSRGRCFADAAKVWNALSPRTAGDAAGRGRKNEQAGRRRSRNKRDHCENSSWRGDAKNGCTNPGGPGPDGRCAQAQGVVTRGDKRSHNTRV